MKKYQLLTAAAMACSLGVVAPTAVIAADGDVSNPTIEVAPLAEPTPVANPADLADAIADPNVAEIVLAADIVVDQALVIERNLTLNLGGFTLSSATANIRLLDIKKGTVNLTGTGTILTTGAGGIPVRVYGSDDPAATNYTVVTVGKDVTLKTTADNVYGIFISYVTGVLHAYGVVINIDGTIDAANGPYINGKIRDTEGNVPVININDGATITANGSNSGAIYAAGYAKWNIGAATLTGKSGLIVKSGEINLTGTTVTANGVEANPDPYSDGFNGTGAAIQVEQNGGEGNYAGKIDITINGGTYTSENSNAVLAYTDDKPEDLQQFESLTINGGTFTAAEGHPVINFIQPEDPEATGTVDDKAIVAINGGSFSSDVTDYVAEGSTLKPVDDGNGNISWEVSTPEPVVPPVDEEETNPEAPNSGAISAAEHTYFTNASAIWAGVAILTVAGAVIVTCRRAGKQA